ncbi:MAG: ATPase domain-containing protein [Acidobacteriaceae bacterium]
MPSAAALRLQIESALADRIPSALTPAPRVLRPTAPTGIAALDERLGGGLPLGAISELTGPEGSGRTSLALSFVAGLTEAGRVCAWIDVSDALDPESAAAAGVDLDRLLWVRCGRKAQQLPLPGMKEIPPAEGWEKQPSLNIEPNRVPHICPVLADGGFHDSGPLAKRLLAVREDFAPRCAEPQPTVRRKSREAVSAPRVPPVCPVLADGGFRAAKRPLAVREYSRLDQALRAADLLLQAGGFSAIVLDMGSIAPEFALRVPLTSWFRYRAAAERTQASVILLTQQACTKSSAGLVLTLAPAGILSEGETVLTGAAYRVEIARERFARATESSRKPPQSDFGRARSSARDLHALSGFPGPVRWQSRMSWADRTVGQGSR